MVTYENCLCLIMIGILQYFDNYNNNNNNLLEIFLLEF